MWANEQLYSLTQLLWYNSGVKVKKETLMTMCESETKVMW